MPMKNADKAKGSPFSQKFQGAVTLIEYEGQPVVVLREFGAFLGYSDDGRQLVNLVTSDWSDEFIEHVDYILVKNGRLAEFKKICANLGLDLVDKRAPSLLLLTKSGMEIVLARTEKPQGKVFRRWLVSEAIPGYEAAKSGRALPGSSAPRIEGPAASAAPAPAPARMPGRRERAPLPAGPARPLLELLDRYRRAHVLDVAAWHALRALAEPLAELHVEPPAAGAPPPPRPPRALPGPATAIDGEHDADAPGLVPLGWAARPDFITERYASPCPDLVEPYTGLGRAELCVALVHAGPYLSDGALRALARWMGRCGIHKHLRWRDVLRTTRESLARAKQ